MDSKVFWGIIVVLIGVSIIANSLFKINFPFFRVILALAIIYFGVKMLVGAFSTSSTKIESGDSIFSKSKTLVTDLNGAKEFNAIFGSQVIDLTEATWEEVEAFVETNTVFGNTIIILPNDIDIQIESNVVFGNVRTPDGANASFGDQNTRLKPKGISRADKKLSIEINAVFGGVRVVYS